MASLRNEAQHVLDIAKDGIGWIAVWKVGRSWNCREFYPDVTENRGACQLTLDEDDLVEIREILAEDQAAILVNSWYDNLGDCECMTRDSLAEALRWQYEQGHNRAADLPQLHELPDFTDPAIGAWELD